MFPHQKVIRISLLGRKKMMILQDLEDFWGWVPGLFMLKKSNTMV